MENLDLNIENYSLHDILKLFNLNESFHEIDLKNAKKKVPHRRRRARRPGHPLGHRLPAPLAGAETAAGRDPAPVEVTRAKKTRAKKTRATRTKWNYGEHAVTHNR